MYAEIVFSLPPSIILPVLLGCVLIKYVEFLCRSLLFLWIKSAQDEKELGFHEFWGAKAGLSNWSQLT